MILVDPDAKEPLHWIAFEGERGPEPSAEITATEVVRTSEGLSLASVARLKMWDGSSQVRALSASLTKHNGRLARR